MKAVACLTKNRETLLAFSDFPAEHWQHIGTTNPHRGRLRHRPASRRSQQGMSFPKAAMAMVFKLVMAASKTWRRLNSYGKLPRINSYGKLPRINQGVQLTDGIQADQTQTRAAA